jgi:hypothetical protein
MLHDIFTDIRCHDKRGAGGIAFTKPDLSAPKALTLMEQPVFPGQDGVY